MLQSLTLLALTATAFAADRPAPALNANPTDTSQARLVGKLFPFAQLPPHVDTNNGIRGPQSGFNICNSTTQNQDSKCQTLIVNSIQDFCIWGPATPNASIGDTEGDQVAWCTTAAHGTRVIPPGTFTGLQFIRTPSYLAITANIDQTKINVANGDFGGELDSGGQDDRGNPIGAAVYSSNLPFSPGVLTQARTWHNFIGGNVVCQKVCDDKAPDALGLCEHVYDRIGCNYNVPASYVDGVFLSCEGADQDPVGVYTGADGKVSTYHQEPEGVTPSPPYTPKIPQTSQCTTYQSTALFTVSVSGATTASSATTTGTSSGSSTKSGSSSGASSGSSSGTGTGTASGAGSTGTGGASAGFSTAASGASTFLATLLAGAALLLGTAFVA